MKGKLKIGSIVILGIIYLGSTSGILLPKFDPLFALPLSISSVLLLQIVVKTPVAFILGLVTSMMGGYGINQVDKDIVWAIPVFIFFYWVIFYFIYMHLKKFQQMEQEKLEVRDSLAKEIRTLKQEIEFYDNKKNDHINRADQRHRLSKAARDLGALLNSDEIFQKLVHLAKEIFSDEPIKVSQGHEADVVDRQVIKKKKCMLIPNETIKGDPLMAVPIEFQKSIVGVLRVGGRKREPFKVEDLRLCEILGTLASMALANSYLFSRVQDSALRDGLTGLLTHRAFQDELESALQDAQNSGGSFSLILTDIDLFKSVNDRYGHQVGDHILQGFSHVMVRNAPETAVVARYGGEEFSLILINSTQAEAIFVAEQIREDFAQLPFEVGGQRVTSTGSFGVATYPEDGQEGPEVLKKADKRLYRAKELGRNRVCGQ